MNCSFALLLVSLVLAVRRGLTGGAGRAFPIHSENYIIDEFRSINPSLDWDPTNFLVNKAGEFANCDQIKRGYQQIHDVTQKGFSIGAIFDHVTGDGVDVGSVRIYIDQLVDGWMNSGKYESTIRGADLFGCSVRPGCRGVVTVVCLFSPARYFTPSVVRNTRPPFIWRPTVKATRRPRHRHSRRPKPPRTPFVWRPTTSLPIVRRPITRPTILPQREQQGTQRGQAFTREQYELAGHITGHKWDRSHFLENLSGFEITCSMLGNDDWKFSKSRDLARQHGIRVAALNGEAPNLGTTEQAMEVILKRFKPIKKALGIGCSIIPDCRTGRADVREELWVVITCLYQTA